MIFGLSDGKFESKQDIQRHSTVKRRSVPSAIDESLQFDQLQRLQLVFRQGLGLGIPEWRFSCGHSQAPRGVSRPAQRSLCGRLVREFGLRQFRIQLGEGLVTCTRNVCLQISL